jgi:hypothetical protein
MILKILGTEIALSTANTVNNSKLVRIVNPTASSISLTLADTSANTTSSITVIANEVTFIEKAVEDTVVGAGLLATPVAYRS